MSGRVSPLTSLLRYLVGAGLAVVWTCSHSETLEGRVVRVYDGDTLTLLVDHQKIRVRLLEIDAPERRQAFGKRSQQSLYELCGATQARVTWNQKDRDGRPLGRVWCRGVDANAEQVRRGMAWVFDRYAKDQSLYPLQTAARAERLGLWADENPLPPWEYRRLKR